MGKFLSDFKEFAMKGNIIDMAVGVIIGGAFGKIVSSLVNDIIIIDGNSSRGRTEALEVLCSEHASQVALV